jgi:hypothetical protein
LFFFGFLGLGLIGYGLYLPYNSKIVKWEPGEDYDKFREREARSKSEKETNVRNYGIFLGVGVGVFFLSPLFALITCSIFSNLISKLRTYFENFFKYFK